MKKIKLIIIFLIIIFLTSINYAQEATTSGKRQARGGQPGAFMSWGAGARSLAMGKAYTGIADDATATYWNPAGLSQVGRQELTALHAAFWGGTSYDFIAYAIPVIGIGTLGISGIQLSSGGFEKRDINNSIIGTFKEMQEAYGISYGKQIMDVLALGASFKHMSHTMDNHTNGKYMVDIGVLFHPSELLQVGVKIQNVVGWQTGEATEVDMPMTMRAGAEYKLLKDKLSLVADAEYYKTESKNTFVDLHGGVEFWALNYLAVRLGMDADEFTGGFGLKYRDYELDYAFATHELGINHRFSATLRFGPSIAAASESQAMELYREGMQAYEKGFYMKSSEKLTAALSFDPKNTEINEKLYKIDTISKVVPKTTGVGKEADLFRQAITKYVDGDVDAMLNILRYLRSMDPSNTEVNTLIRVIKKEEGIKETEAEQVKGMNLIDQKLSESLEYFYNGKYNKVVELSNEVLSIDPNNALAYKRIGSAYYAIGQKEKAIEAWEMSMRLNPQDVTLKTFIEKAKEDIRSSGKKELEYIRELDNKEQKGFFE